MYMHEAVHAHKNKRQRQQTKPKQTTRKPVLGWQDAQRIKALVANPEDLSLIPVFWILEGHNQILHTEVCVCVCKANKSQNLKPNQTFPSSHRVLTPSLFGSWSEDLLPGLLSVIAAQ